MTEWTSLWPVTPASHFPQPGSDSEQKTLATSGHTSPDQYELFDLDYASLRMSKDISPSASEKSLESWNQSVTKRRGEYSARVKSALRTSGSGCSSWPTIRASEYKDTGPIGSKSHDHMLGKGYLCAVVTQDAANWPTPTTAEAGKIGNQPNFGQLGLSNHPAIVGGIDRPKGEKSRYGQAAPANPSTDGSRQGLWLTPRANEPDSDSNFVARNADRGEHCHPSLSQQAKSMWPTITAHTPDMESSGPNGNAGTYLAGQVKAWATPRVGGEEKAETRLARGKDIGLHGQVGAMKNTAKLNPRWVETLMGRPVGWVMPSCKSPVTIERTNCDSSATESCLPPQSEHSELFGRES